MRIDEKKECIDFDFKLSGLTSFDEKVDFIAETFNRNGIKFLIYAFNSNGKTFINISKNYKEIIFGVSESKLNLHKKCCFYKMLYNSRIYLRSKDFRSVVDDIISNLNENSDPALFLCRIACVKNINEELISKIILESDNNYLLTCSLPLFGDEVKRVSKLINSDAFAKKCSLEKRKKCIGIIASKIKGGGGVYVELGDWSKFFSDRLLFLDEAIRVGDGESYKVVLKRLLKTLTPGVWHGEQSFRYLLDVLRDANFNSAEDGVLFNRIFADEVKNTVSEKLVYASMLEYLGDAAQRNKARKFAGTEIYKNFISEANFQKEVLDKYHGNSRVMDAVLSDVSDDVVIDRYLVLGCDGYSKTEAFNRVKSESIISRVQNIILSYVAERSLSGSDASKNKRIM